MGDKLECHNDFLHLYFTEHETKVQRSAVHPYTLHKAGLLPLTAAAPKTSGQDPAKIQNS